MPWCASSATVLVLVALSGCEARLTLGGACSRDGECPAPLVCGSGRCRAECVEQRDCPLGALCVVNPETGARRCSLPDDPDCRVRGSECASGLLCVVDHCVNTCDTVAACPNGSVCVLDAEGRAYCDRADVDAGPPPDVGSPDAGLLDVGSDGAGSIDAALDAPTPCVGPGPGCDRVVDVAVVGSGSCAVTERGAVWCWGREGALSLGAGAPVPFCASAGSNCAATPVRARVEHGGTTRDLSGATAISGANLFTVVEAGRAFSWGGVGRTLGAVGAGEIAHAVRVEPGATFLAADVRRIVQGWTAALAETSAGERFMWGDEDLGQRGAGVGAGSDFAMPADPLPGGDTPSLGGAHGCSILGGVVSCWGENDVGQAGGTTIGVGAIVPVATPVPGVPSGATHVAAGRSQSCALADGAAYCWGMRAAIGNSGEPVGCQDGSAGRACPATLVAWGGAPFVELFTGGYSEDTCAVTDAGALWCWGPNSGLEPVRIDLPTPVTDVARSDLHACAVGAGEVYCWGANVFGQLGRGTEGEAWLAEPAAVAWPE